MLIGLFETASADPFWYSPDTFEVIWPSDAPKQVRLRLQCRSFEGIIEYTNTIQCISSSCTGEEINFEGENRGSSYASCDLNFNILGTDYIVHYVKPLPVRCNTESGVDDDGVHWAETQCSWYLDLSDRRVWNGVVITGIPPTITPTSLPSSVMAKTVSGQTLSGIRPTWVDFLVGLLLAWIVEIFVLLLISLNHLEGNSLRRIILLGLLMTLVTLPILWYILPVFLSGVPYILIGESLVILIEAGILKFGLNIGFAKALLISLVVNLASFVAGLLFLNPLRAWVNSMIS
jgi:hypothetical protein